MSSTDVPLSCPCHVARCAICSACSRCSCSHDGVEINVKISRQQGRPSSVKKRCTEYTRQLLDAEVAGSCNTTLSFDVDESSNLEATIAPVNQQESVTIKRSPLALFQSLGYDSNSALAAIHNLPSAASRSNPTFWKDISNTQCSLTINVIHKIVCKVCDVLCEENKDALVAAASAYLTLQHAKSMASTKKQA